MLDLSPPWPERQAYIAPRCEAFGIARGLNLLAGFSLATEEEIAFDEIEDMGEL